MPYPRAPRTYEEEQARLARWQAFARRGARCERFLALFWLVYLVCLIGLFLAVRLTDGWIFGLESIFMAGMTLTVYLLPRQYSHARFLQREARREVHTPASPTPAREG